MDITKRLVARRLYVVRNLVQRLMKGFEKHKPENAKGHRTGILVEFGVLIRALNTQAGLKRQSQLVLTSTIYGQTPVAIGKMQVGCNGNILIHRNALGKCPSLSARINVVREMDEQEHCGVLRLVLSTRLAGNLQKNSA